MPRMRDTSKDPTPDAGPMHGPEDYIIHEQGYESRPIGSNRGSLRSVEPKGK